MTHRLRVQAGALALLLSWPVLLHPLSINQGVYVFGGELLLNGGALYRDLFDPKGPMLFASYALLRTFVAAASVPGVLQLICCVAAAVLAAELAVRRFGPGAGLPAAVWAALSLPTHTAWGAYVSSPMWTGEGEDLGAVALLLALVAWDRRRPAAAGVALGFAVCVKQTFALPAVVLFALILWARRGEALRFVVGAVVLPSVVVGLSLAAGVFEDLFTALVSWPLGGYVGVDGSAGPSAVLKAALRVHNFRAGLPLAVALIFGGRRGGQGLLALTLSVGLTVLLQGRGWPYHFKPLWALGAVYVGGALATGPWVKRWSPRWVVPAAGVLAAILSAGHPRAQAQAMLMTAKFTDTAVEASEYRRAAAWIRTELDSTPDRRLYVWGLHAPLFVDAEARPPGRFVFSLPLVSPSSVAASLRVREAGALAARPPHLVVFTAPPEAPEDLPHTLEADPSISGMLWNSRAMLAAFPALLDRLRVEYEPWRRVGKMRIWRRRR